MDISKLQPMDHTLYQLVTNFAATDEQLLARIAAHATDRKLLDLFKGEVLRLWALHPTDFESALGEIKEALVPLSPDHPVVKMLAEKNHARAGDTAASQEPVAVLASQHSKNGKPA